MQNQLGGELEAAVRALTDPHRRVVLLVDVAGLSYAEAAAVPGVPEGTVMRRLRILRATLLASRADEAAEAEAVERLGGFAAKLASRSDGGPTDRGVS